MNRIQLIFPHQLYEDTSYLEQGCTIFLVEEYLFFRQYNFHKQKLIFHRATMKYYELYLRENGFNVEYISANDERNDVRDFIRLLPDTVREVFYYDPVDDWLQKRIISALRKRNIKGSPINQLANFLNAKEDLPSFFRVDKKKHFQTTFYINERKRLGLLLDETNAPLGGKWSFDTENRKKYPRKKIPPGTCFPVINPFYEEAVQYVSEQFPGHIGNSSTQFTYPTTFDEARVWLRQFLEQRFDEFGTYEDAIVANESILHHSLLSPLLNTGLLTPQAIISETLSFAERNNIPVNSLEGFIRQIIGWREFIRGMYEVKGSEMRTRNLWGFKRKLPASFYTGDTGIVPVDTTIKKVLETGYCHHIERLMILGNFMLLCEFDPDEVYQWFMELFIDSYDWVMVPNVYAMSQFADGGTMTTKPYISSSNYIKKMSDYKNGEWTTIWDALFWRFLSIHRDVFVQAPRLKMLIRTYDKMPAEKRGEIHQIAARFLEELTR